MRIVQDMIKMKEVREDAAHLEQRFRIGGFRFIEGKELNKYRGRV